MLSRAGAVPLARLLPPGDGKEGAPRSGEGTAAIPTVCPPGSPPERNTRDGWLLENLKKASLSTYAHKAFVKTIPCKTQCQTRMERSCLPGGNIKMDHEVVWMD